MVHIREIPEGHSVIEQQVTMTDEQIQEGKLCGDVKCRAEVERLQYQIFLRITYTCRVNQECSRCLTSFEYPLKGEATVILQAKNAPESLGSDEVDYFFSDRDTTVDIRQSLYDEVMINIPIKPLCREECAGVTDYIDKDAIKGKDEIDPRWEALKKLKEKK
jgi:uncharacterized protein